MRQIIGVPMMLGILVLAAGAFLIQCACHGVYEVAGWFREACERALKRLEEVLTAYENPTKSKEIG